MLFFGIKNFWFRLVVFLVLTIGAAVFTFWMYQNYYITDPYDPTLTGTKAYGHNGEGAFEAYGVMTLIEYAILLSVLIPYSFSRFYWIRVLILQILFGVWMMMMAIASMHSGTVHIIHLMWLFAVNVILFVLLVLSVVAEITGRNKLQQLETY